MLRTLSKFERLGGYDIVEKAKKGWETWGIISELAKKTKISRPTIYEVRKRFAERPKRILPVYVEEFGNSRGYEILKEKLAHTMSTERFRALASTTLQAFKVLKNKDPISWDEADFLKLWQCRELRDPLTNYIESNKSVFLRAVMKAIGRHDLRDKFPTKKRPNGTKRLWYLKDDEIKRLIETIQEIDTLLFMRFGIEGGGRASAILSITPEQIDYEQRCVNVYEKKTKEWIPKFYQAETLDMAKRYIHDFDIKPKQRLFPRTRQTYSHRLEFAGQLTDIEKTLSSHILKHTFVSQASARGVSLDTISDQTGTDPTTLKDYYQARNVAKQRHELLAEPYDPEPFGVWVKSLDPLYKKRYEELIENACMERARALYGFLQFSVRQR